MEQLHAVQWGQRSEQAGVKAHGQQVPQPTLIKSLCTCMKKGVAIFSLLFQAPFAHKIGTRDKKIENNKNATSCAHDATADCVPCP